MKTILDKLINAKIMKEKDKATQLVNKFKLEPIKPFCIMHLEHSKQCALICVDEIINLDIDVHYLDYWYWQRVKNEIQNL